MIPIVVPQPTLLFFIISYQLWFLLLLLSIIVFNNHFTTTTPQHSHTLTLSDLQSISLLIIYDLYKVRKLITIMTSLHYQSLATLENLSMLSKDLISNMQQIVCLCLFAVPRCTCHANRLLQYFCLNMLDYVNHVHVYQLE